MPEHCSKKAYTNSSKIMIGTIAALLLAATSALNQNAYAADKRMTVQAANMHKPFGAYQKLDGAGILTRSADELSATLNLTELGNGGYTAWWFVFNYPEYCTFGRPGELNSKCGEQDMGTPEVEGSIFYATGFLTTTGTVNFSTSLKSGDIPEGAAVVVGQGGNAFDNGVKPGLKRRNGLKAEIQMVIRTHGEILPGRVNEQTGSYNGGCDPVSGDDEQHTTLPGPNVCQDVQVVDFAPVQN